MLTAFLATWPLWLTVAAIAAGCVYADRRDIRNARIQAARSEENRKTLAHIREQEQRDRAKAAQRRGQDTPHTTTDRALRIAPVTSIDEARRDVRRQQRDGGAA